MPTAPNQYALKRRLDRYFWANKSAEMTQLQTALSSHFCELGRVAVVGGLVRDFARKGRSGFRSDVDLVIDASAGEIERLAERLGARSNRFGGHGCKIGSWKIDFWALETTWGRHHVPVQKLEDIISCTFFDWDAVAYDLHEKTLICSNDYLDRVSNRTLDINLRPNPSPKGNLVRAIRRLILWHVNPGPQLRQFIEENLDDGALRFVQAKECELFSHRVSLCWDTALDARNALLRNRVEGYPRQLDLPLEEPEDPDSIPLP